MNKSNLDFLRTAVFLNKEFTKETDNIVDGHIKMDSREFNQIFLDPYKSMILNTAGRLKTATYEEYSHDEFTMREISKDDLLSCVKSYSIMNIEDVLMSTGASFIDDLASQFIYEDVNYEEHYEFDTPFDLLKRSDNNIVVNAYNEIDCDKKFLTAISYTNENYDNEKDLTVQNVVGCIFDALYSVFVRTYYNKIVTSIAIYYISRPTMIKDFYKSFLDENFVPFTENGYNNIYSYITIALRDMMKPKIEIFKDTLYIISNTVSSMILGYKIDNYSNTYDNFMHKNPFAYEILIEKYGNKEEKESDE